MKNWNYLKSLFSALIAIAATAFAACVDDNEDTEAPYLEVAPATLNFDADGIAVDGRDWFEVRTNRSWTASMDAETSAWLTLAPESGDGTTKVAVSVPAGNRSGKITFTISNAMGSLKSQTVAVNVGEVKPEEVIFKETAGTGDVTNNPFVDQYTAWDTTGTGAGEVTYSGQTVSVRKSGIANNGSGPNVLFFGQLPAWFSVNKIALTPEQTDLKLTFLGQCSFKPEGGEYDNTFDKSTFKVALSGDGQTWTEIDYTTDNGDAEYPYWVNATANFSLKEASQFLYIRFTAEKASAYRLDDIVLATGTGGQEVDLGAGSVDPGPDPEKDALFYENFGNGDKVDNNWAYIDQYTDYSKSGAAYVAGTTTYAGSSASVRTNSYNSAPVPPFSGAGHVWFAAGGGTLTVSKLVLESTQTKLQLSVGVLGGDASGKVTYDPTSDNLKFELSADGNAWTAIDNDKIVFEAQGEGTEKIWTIATVDFTLKSAVPNLYIRFSGKALRLDDATLSVSETGGVEIDLGGGSTTDPAVTTADYASLTATSVVLGGSYANLTPTQVGVQYIASASGSDDQIDWTQATEKQSATTTESWTVQVDNLTAETRYAYRAFATTTEGDLYGSVKTFTTTAVPEEATVDQVIAGSLGKLFEVEGTIVGTHTKGLILKDDTGLLYVYLNEAPTLSVGDVVTVTGTSASYGNLIQLGNNPVVTLVSEGSYTQPTPEQMTGTEIDAYVNGTPPLAVRYVQYTGELSISSSGSNTYYNVTVAGATAKGSLTYVAADQIDATLSGKTVTVTGYTIGTPNANLLYMNTMVVSIVEDQGGSTDTPTITSLTPDALEWDPTATNGTTIAIAGTNLEGAKFTLSTLTHFAAQMWGSDQIVVAPYSANDTDKNIVETLTVTVEGGNSKTVTLTHKTANIANEEIETFAKYPESLLNNSTGYTNSGSFKGVTSGNPIWNYTGCGNPTQASKDKTTLEEANLTVSPDAVYIAMGRNGTLSVTIEGGLSGLKFNTLTSSSATGEVSVSLVDGTVLKSATIAKNSKTTIELTDIESTGQDVVIEFKETSGANRFTVGDVVLTK